MEPNVSPHTLLLLALSEHVWCIRGKYGIFGPCSVLELSDLYYLLHKYFLIFQFLSAALIKNNGSILERQHPYGKNEYWGYYTNQSNRFSEQISSFPSQLLWMANFIE